ncbi:hypothetical protein DENSPDRAFT_656574 [Dentipellis sp. KUC8613]|nr:hypothetical protein DENSPDRAFT_656574 [Dentipellis sp. KUC8613]
MAPLIPVTRVLARRMSCNILWLSMVSLSLSDRHSKMSFMNCRLPESPITLVRSFERLAYICSTVLHSELAGEAHSRHVQCLCVGTQSNSRCMAYSGFQSVLIHPGTHHDHSGKHSPIDRHAWFYMYNQCTATTSNSPILSVMCV